jgi:hypothetical protein
MSPNCINTGHRRFKYIAYTHIHPCAHETKTHVFKEHELVLLGVKQRAVQIQKRHVSLVILGAIQQRIIHVHQACKVGG